MGSLFFAPIVCGSFVLSPCFVMQYLVPFSNFYITSLRKRELVALLYTTLTNFSTKYFTMYKVHTDVGGIK